MTGSQDTLLNGDRPEVRPVPGQQDRRPGNAPNAIVPDGDEATRITVDDFATPVGAVGFIGKPFTLDQLVLAVRHGAPPPVDGGRGTSPPPVHPPLVPV